MMISSQIADSSQVPPLRSPLDLNSAAMAHHHHPSVAGQPPNVHQSPAGLTLGPASTMASLQSLQSLNPLGIGVGYAMPMHMAPFRPLYMTTPDVAPLGVDPSLSAKSAKSTKAPVVGKRMKVSRACDECRRKKTRCDIDSESDVCSLCRRANVMCTFARQQLKRGPARKRSSQPLPLTGSASPPAARPPATRARSRSTSDSIKRGKESPVLPPIETLLSYQKAYGQDQGQAAPIPIPRQQQQQQHQHTYGHEPQVSPPIMEYHQSISAGSKHHSSPKHLQQHIAHVQHQHEQQPNSQVPPSQQQQKSELSGFPVLVEVACSQGKSGSPEQSLSGATPSSLGASVKMTPPSSVDSASDIPVKAPTPPNYYDGGLHGVTHQALMEYYTFCHPIFPILPNSIAEFDAVFRDAGPMRQCLVAAINSAVADGVDTTSSVPFGLGGSRLNGADREAHLMALLFVYIQTLEYTWLGAAVAECAALNAEPMNPRTERLTALIAVFDRLHGIIFGTRSLFPADLHTVAMRYVPIVPTLTALLTPAAPSGGADRFRTAPEIALATLGQLGTPGSSSTELLATLETLAPQVQRTPLEKFVAATLARHRGSEEPQL